MSNSGGEAAGAAGAAGPNGAAGVPDELVRLEGAVRRLLDELAGYRACARVAEDRVAELERTVRDMSDGGLDPLELRDGMRKLEAENEDLRDRMEEAQTRIRRLVARFDFLREEM